MKYEIEIPKNNPELLDGVVQYLLSKGYNYGGDTKNLEEIKRYYGAECSRVLP